jgi:hypothetical protein
MLTRTKIQRHQTKEEEEKKKKKKKILILRVEQNTCLRDIDNILDAEKTRQTDQCTLRKGKRRAHAANKQKL